MNDRLRESGAGQASQPIFIMPNEIKFPAPEGFSVPEDSDPTKPFEVMASVTLGEDGMLSLSAIDGAPVSIPQESDDMGYDETDEAMGGPSGDGFLVAIEQGVSKKSPKGRA
jgi:hypothetical protein